jgi:hypothetical protein
MFQAARLGFDEVAQRRHGMSNSWLGLGQLEDYARPKIAVEVTRNRYTGTVLVKF